MEVIIHQPQILLHNLVHLARDKQPRNNLTSIAYSMKEQDVSIRIMLDSVKHKPFYLSLLALKMTLSVIVEHYQLVWMGKPDQFVTFREF